MRKKVNAKSLDKLIMPLNHLIELINKTNKDYMVNKELHGF